LSRTLQSPTLSAVQGKDCASKTVSVLRNLRNEEDFKQFWKNVTTKATALKVDDPKLPRKRGVPKKLEDFQGYGPAKPAQPEEPEDLYRKHYFEALDLVINCINDRFDQEDYKTYAMTQELLLKAAKNQNYDSEFAEVTKFYHSDLDESLLKSQLKILGDDIPTITEMNFSDIVEYLKSLHTGMRKHQSEIFLLSKLTLVCPATNATSERSFSALRRVKNYLQSTMNQVRLNNVMMLHVHKDRTDGLSLIDVGNEFVSGSEHRVTIFGKFESIDTKRSQTLMKSISTQVSYF